MGDKVRVGPAVETWAAGTSFAPPHGLVICGLGCVPSWCLRWRKAQPPPPPAVRTATRQPKEIKCLLVLASLRTPS
jgi:hypothetical protein